MATGNITKRSVTALGVPERGKNFLWDVKVRGFGVFVTPSGRRSYVLQYRMNGRGPTKRFTIGQHGSPWTPKHARDRAVGLLSKIVNGVDPMEEKREARSAAQVNEELRFENYITVFAELYLDARGLRTAPEFHQIMRDYALPAFGSKLITEITKKNIIDLIDKVSEHSRSAANKTFDWLRTLMNFARSRSVMDGSPLDGLKRPHKTNNRDRVLSDSELQRLWEGASDLGFPFDFMFKMLALTGKRTVEVRGIRGDEIDLDRRIWVIPKERMKGGRYAHLVPLTSTIIELLEKHWPAGMPRGLLISNANGRMIRSSGHHKGRLDIAIARRMKIASDLSDEPYEEMPYYQLHDLRRTIATGMQSLGVSMAHIEAILAHVPGSHIGQTTMVKLYQLHKYEPEKRAAYEKWHAHIAALMSRDDAWPGGRSLPNL